MSKGNLGVKITDGSGLSIDISSESGKADEVDADLGLRLLNREELSERDLTKLTDQLVTRIGSLLKSGKKAQVQSFLRQHKNHLTSLMRDMISVEIALMDVKGK